MLLGLGVKAVTKTYNKNDTKAKISLPLIVCYNVQKRQYNDLHFNVHFRRYIVNENLGVLLWKK